MEEFNFQPDPLLRPGTFIDPLLRPGAFIDLDTPSNGAPELKPFASGDPAPQASVRKSNGKGKRGPAPSAVNPTAVDVVDDPPFDENGRRILPPPDWLSSDWYVEERLRNNGASAGSRDKYYVCSVTKRKFRSKKEVLHYLETGSTKKRKIEADSAPATAADSVATAADSVATAATAAAKSKKSEPKSKKPVKEFAFEDVPATVKWKLSDVYEGTWRPLMNGAKRVPESAKKLWAATFTDLALQRAGGNTGFF